MKRIELREYGYTDEWRSVRGLEDGEAERVRGVIAQELRQVFPEHIQILDELEMEDEGVTLENFHQVDKQGLVMDGELQHCFIVVLSFKFNLTKMSSLCHFPQISDWSITSSYRKLPNSRAYERQN